MKLIDDWKVTLKKAWSMRIAIFTLALAVADQVLALFNTMIPPFVYALLSAAIIIARVVYQANLSTSDPAKAP